MSYHMKYRWVIYWFFVYNEPANTAKLVKIYSDTTLNLVPRVLRLFGQRVGARGDSGELEFYLNVLIGYSVTASIVLPQNSRGNKIPVPLSISRRPPADQNA